MLYDNLKRNQIFYLLHNQWKKDNHIKKQKKKVISMYYKNSPLQSIFKPVRKQLNEKGVFLLPINKEPQEHELELVKCNLPICTYKIIYKGKNPIYLEIKKTSFTN
jgi:DNA-directed RNA polymerase subunit RPC12/RpoP